MLPVRIWNASFGSISGTPLNQFGIYCDKKTQDYIYNKDKYNTTEAAFKAIKSEIHSILEAAKKFIIDKDWESFSQIFEGEFEIQRHVRSKILSIYYPNELLQLNSNKAAEHILESLFGIPKKQIDKGLFLKKAKLTELKNAHRVMKEWSNYDFFVFIWEATYLDKELVWLVLVAV